MKKLSTLRDLPSVEIVTKSSDIRPLFEKHSRERIVDAIRRVIDSFREAILKSEEVDVSTEKILSHVEKLLKNEDTPSLKRVINATGTVIHTNLGRAELPGCAVDAIGRAASGTVNLEYDIEKGKRGSRDTHLEELICRLTGAEAATVVNNNAAAVLLVLSSLAKRKEVIVSRGELVEIGGSFRIPDVIRASGCKLVETGTTNKTRIEDYRSAITPKTGVLLKVHTSNYKIIGFTESAGLDSLAALGKESSLPVVEDLGSGAVIDLSEYGLPKEPVVSERIALGADIVTFSGDKLLGGPQAGIIAGKKELIIKINKNPLKRALRVDKLTIAALESVLKLYLDQDKLLSELPTLHYLSKSMEEMRIIAAEAAEKLKSCFGNEAEIDLRDDVAEPGSGALPGETISSVTIAMRHKRLSPNKLAKLFRENDPPIIGRVNNDLFLLDLRCIDKSDDLILVSKTT